MEKDNKNALDREPIDYGCNHYDKSIIPQNWLDSAYEDFGKSGINRDVTDRYINKGLLIPNDNGWKMIYVQLYGDKKTEYYNQRQIKYEGKRKYLNPKGITSQLFRPIDLPIEAILDKETPIIITEGCKKAIKATQEGFYCVAVAGVNNWKMKPKENDGKESDEIDEVADIIPDIKNWDIEGKTIILCFDSDIWEKEQVQQALYEFACYLIGEKKAKVKILLLPKGKDKGLDDFLKNRGKQEFEKLLNKCPYITLKEIQRILSDEDDNDINFPKDVFNPIITQEISNLSERMDSSFEYLSCAFLVCISIVMNGKYSLTIDSESFWVENPILWTAIVGGASNAKTPCLNYFKKFITEIEMELNSKYEKKLEEYKKAKKIYDLEVQKNKNKKEIDRNLILNEPKKPVNEVITTQDTTVEALASLVKKTNFPVAILTDELASYFKGLGQYKKGGGNDNEYYLQSWKNQQYRFTRKTEDENFIITPSHNIVGTIQPTVLNETLFKDGVKTTNGMIERWLFCCTKYEETGAKNRTVRINQELFSKLFQNLYSNQEQKIYTFSNEAKNTFDDYCKSIVMQKKSARTTELEKSYLQKQTDYAARFALILHCLETPEQDEISFSTICKAIKICKYFIACFKVVTNDTINKNSNALEFQTLEYIKNKGCKPITPSKLYESNRSRYKSTQLAEKVLDKLRKMGYGRLYKTNNSGKKFIFYSD